MYLIPDFPFVDRSVTKRRPVLCVAHLTPQKDTSLYWVLMITSTETKSWSGDIDIVDFKDAGLPVSSIVRTAKIACIEGSLISKKVGSIDAKTHKAVFNSINTTLST